MNLDDRIKEHLEETTSTVQAPDRLEEVMASGRRRRVRRNTFSVLGTAAVVAAVMSVTPLLIPDRSTGTPSVATQPDTSPSSAPPATTAAANIVPQGIVTVSSHTVAIFEADGSTSEFDLEGARTVYPDQEGGLIYTTESAIHRLGGGETTTLAEGAVGVGPGSSAEGNPLFFYLSEPDSVVAVDLSTGETTPVTDLAEGDDVTAGGSLVAVMDRSGDCPVLRLVDLDSGELPSPLGEDCLPQAAGLSVSTNGRYLGVLVGDDFRSVEIDSGETVLERTYPDGYMATAGPGGWAIRTPSQTVLLANTGESWNLPAVGQSDWAIPFAQPLDLAGEEAQRQEHEDRVAEETEEAACGAAVLTAPDQDLPDPVADTRQHLLDQVSTCNSDALADLSRRDGTNLSFGEVDPTSFWQDDERVSLLAQVLSTRPAYDADAGVWAWPAVQVDPDDEESWAEVTEIMPPDLVAQMRQNGSYLGYRVGIADDGTWQYFVGGD